MKSISFRARCPHCRTERDLLGPWPASTPAELDRIELEMSRRGTTIARCPTCNRVEEVAMHVDAARVEPWQDADAMERQHGLAVGKLPPKPWLDTN